jgi:AcrR family transcriptional regulator
LEAFADKDYRDVQVTAIIEQAGISDGSSIQYFTDKKDLFLHMLEAIKQEKISFMQSKNANGRARGESFFNIIKAAVYNGIRFGLERPLHMRFLDRMFESPIKAVAIEEVKQAALNYWKGMIEQGITTGELRKDISVELLAERWRLRVLSLAVISWTKAG